MEEPKVSIIILNYNAGNLLENCLNSVFNTDYSNFEVIVVDNDSKDQSHLKSKEKFPQIKLIENNENLGYCKGNNVGINQAGGNFLVILNPDTIVERTWIKELLSAHYKIGKGLLQPKLLTLQDKNRINSAGNMINLFGFGFSRGKGFIDNGQYEKFEKIDYASGACLFVSKETLDKIGLFDSYLFAYHDDLNLGWRAASQGVNSYYVPKSIVYHAESYSFKWSSFKMYLLERNRWYCILTEYSRKTFYKMLPALLILELCVLVFYLAKGNIKEKISGYKDIIKYRQFIHERYLELESRKTIPDKELIKYFKDEIEVPYEMAGQMSAKAFNKMLKFLSKIVRLVL